MIEAKYLKTRHVVETAWGLLDYHAKQVKAKAVSLEEAKQSGHGGDQESALRR